MAGLSDPKVQLMRKKMLKHQFKLTDKFVDDYQPHWIDIFGNGKPQTGPSINHEIMCEGFIYTVRNSKTGRMYIGQTTNLILRKSQHLSALKNFKHESTDMQIDFMKYGGDVFSFEIVEFVLKKEDLREREKYWISWFKSEYPNGYNSPLKDSPFWNEYSKRHSKEFMEMIRLEFSR